ncbi:SusC/RagA family TonB-linked outer membrane protein [Paraflavitalea sp. CAU 1676]|uniref:SusC/RagA family TonB-linked outer membrane protein n=1 Tax=Paraflavitalea sp. CAU 1676 TaxID=3032598 RepID=UPI0023DADE3A|nr:SusC/RagA family TonB-linked outer membrane protein [Paraflavitalea sp. CAU 1676]MDF2193385.1 SusC/RagA family TonB-linked outer membrane protein [Paraflavitalea sp. CAU 1676]
MRVDHIKPKLLGCLLGLQLLIPPVVNAQDSYAYAAGKQKSPQQAEPNRKPEDSSSKQPLFKVLKELNKTKGVYFLFSDESLGEKLVNPAKKDHADVEKILNQILENTGLRYKKVNDKTFVILPSKETAKTDGTANGSAQDEQARLIANRLADQVTGKITDATGAGVAGVSVSVKGTQRGTTTNGEGVFSIEVKDNETLIFSAVGYTTQEIAIAGRTVINVQLAAAGSQMTEVVVTALGVNRRARSITYATQKISGEELTAVKDPNLINSLNGKIAGLTVNRSASGAGGSVKVVMRGNKSTQNNSPLYVIDGIPMFNSSVAQPENLFGQSSGTASAGRDGGDAISNINPEDIESMQVLKGASAAALYGSQAANGAILVTTKKGRAGSARVNVASSILADRVMLKPEAQFSYGQDGANNENGWGSKNGKGDYSDELYQTGITWINSIGLQAGSDRAQTYFSYSNTDNKGVIPTAKFNRHTFTFRENARFFNDKLTVDGLVTLTRQKSTNRPSSGLYNNPQVGVYFFPRNLDFGTYKNTFEVFSPARALMVQNWWNVKYDAGTFGNEYSQNPFWILNRNVRDDSRDRAFSSLTLRYDIAKGLAVQARGSYDVSVDDYDSKMHASTNPIIADLNGRFTWERSKNNVAYGDLLLFYNTKLSSNLSLAATFGGSITDSRTADRTFIDSYGAVNADGVKQGLSIANIFSVQNILSGNASKQQSVLRSQTQSLLGSASLGYKDMFYLDITGRNDWSSALTFTDKLSFLYYSVGATAVLSEIAHLPEVVDLAKVRMSYAHVGNSVRSFATNPPLYRVNPVTGGLIKNVRAAFPNKPLKPEDNRSFEIGTEWRFFGSRLGFDLTWYKNDNYNQYFETPAPSSSGFNTYFLNLGQIRNTGVEIMVTGAPVKSADFDWNTSLNFAANKNTVVNLSEPGVTDETGMFFLTTFDNTYASIVRQGGSFGDIISFGAARDDKGNLALAANGAPVRNTADRKLVGNPNPDFTGGWTNSLRYKNFDLNFLIDGRFGGEVMSITQAELDLRGFSEASVKAREDGGVFVKGTKSGVPFEGKIDAKTYYNAVGGRAGIGEFYMYDATAVRLREVSLGYNVPLKWKGVRSLNVSLIGRNLFFIKREAPFDPEISMSTDNGLQGVDVFGLPATRSFGVNLKVAF